MQAYLDWCNTLQYTLQWAVHAWHSRRVWVHTSHAFRWGRELWADARNEETLEDTLHVMLTAD